MKVIRTYKVWIKGDRFGTQTTVEATGRENAIFQFAMDMQKKMFECDGVWDRSVPSLRNLLK